mmetsp:Transcript_59595/g.172594  ORF Transcript_59595/g.172594 Transcript_59595/m.172594 type:complete len:1690 (+) Transcript_59595:340-5409(+)
MGGGRGDKGGGKAKDDGYYGGGKWGDRKGEKGEKGEKGKDGGKGGEKGKNRSGRVLKTGVRGKVNTLIKGKPSGFIKRFDGAENDVFFDLEDVVDGETLELWDIVEFDIVEGTDRRPYGARIKKLPKDTPEDSGSIMKSTVPVTASKTGSLTGALTGPMSLGPSGAQKKTGGLTGGLSLRPGGALSGGGGLTGGLTMRPGGALSGGLGSGAAAAGSTPSAGAGLPGKDEEDDDDFDGEDDDGTCWGRIVSTKERFGFLVRLGNVGSDTQLFFRAADVVGMNSNDPGTEGKGMEISLPHGRNSNGFKTFWLNVDDEVSFGLSKDHRGDVCAVDVRKERKGAWRSGRRSQVSRNQASKKDMFKDQMYRLLQMDPEQVLHNASLFKDVLESSEFRDNPSHLQSIVALLASKELAEDDRADPLFRIFSDSTAMQVSLRTAIIKHSSGKHSGSFLEECLRCLVQVVLRHPSPQDLRDHLPLAEMVEAWEVNVREGSSSTKKGLPSDVKQNLLYLQKNFPDELGNLDRVLGVRKKSVAVSAAEEYTELLEADDYQEMPILPTSAEMLGQCAFEIQENMRTYERCEDYVQTHFMLLREDYIEPLRAGIKLFMQGKHSPKDLHVYTGVKVVGILSTWEGVVYRVELQKSQTRRINWDKSKQLMYGSLLCLSDDGFETLIWATVWRREADLMKEEGQLDIRLPFEPFDDRFEPGKTFCCIENVTIYFEAYRHVLIALQSMRPTDVPFQNILLSPQPEAVPPGFLKPETDMFHFHNVFQACERPDAPVSAPKSFKVLQEWPSSLLQALDIDPSQLEAINHSLTHAMSLVQGPPGTGKTWVGLKIVQALLDNTREVRHSPILVVCYTNHALDQFLEGIFKFCERIARIGSRSKSEVMKARNLKELVMELQPSREFHQARKGLNERRDALRKEFHELLEAVNRNVVDVFSAREILSEKQFELFYEGYLWYLGDDAPKVKAKYKESDDVDEELWLKMLKVWLETSNLEKLAPVIPKAAGGLPSLDKSQDDEDSDDEVDRKTKEIAEDAEEEEAEQEQHERKLDVEQTEPKKQGMGDFQFDLKNPWLPYWEEYEERMLPENRSLKWGDEAERFWRMPREMRRETYRQWVLQMHHEAREQLPEIARRIERNAESRAALQRDRQLELLREMEVVGMTTTAVSKYQQLLKALRPEVVIVEEAAEVLEAHILTALHPRTQHVILIGDHQQLRPATAVYRLSKLFHLDVSLFERLIHNGADHVTLLQQRRMHPKISRLIKPYYPELRDHASTNERTEVMGVAKRTFFLKHNNLEDDEGESHSKSNTFEVNFISALVAHLIQSGYEESQITVLSPYLGQVRNLKQKLRRDPNTASVLCTAVDNYQGEENDIIIISLVRSNRQRSVGFVAVENRINVALTRARCGMFIVGNADMLRGHSLWSKIISELQSDGSFGEKMPLIEPKSGSVFEVKNADDISCLLEDPSYYTGGEGETFGGFDFDDRKGVKGGRFAVADRWAELGKDERSDTKGYGKGGDRDRRDRDRGSGGYGAQSGKDDRFKGGGQKSRGNGGGKDRERERDREAERDDNGRWGSSYRGAGGGGGGSGGFGAGFRGAGGANSASASGIGASRRAGGGHGDEASGDDDDRPVKAPKQPAPPPPPRMEADGVHHECELLRGRDDSPDVAEGGRKEAGKKGKKTGSGNKVVMRLR